MCLKSYKFCWRWNDRNLVCLKYSGMTESTKPLASCKMKDLPFGCQETISLNSLDSSSWWSLEGKGVFRHLRDTLRSLDFFHVCVPSVDISGDWITCWWFSSSFLKFIFEDMTPEWLFGVIHEAERAKSLLSVECWLWFSSNCDKKILLSSGFWFARRRDQRLQFIRGLC